VSFNASVENFNASGETLDGSDERAIVDAPGVEVRA
jgi:hypothetical protein